VEKRAEIQSEAVQPVLDLRAAERIYAQIQDVQDLLPNSRLEGRNPRRDQGELVIAGARHERR
jgi:hypothetical protein